MSARPAGDARDPGRAAAIVGRPLLLVHQVHGATVLDARDHRGGSPDADALLGRRGDPALGVLGADCALVALGARDGACAVVHAGWRGLLAGVVEAAVDALCAAGSSEIEAVLGPHVCAGCYAFSPEDLDPLVQVYGNGIVARTRRGEVALDLGRTVELALGRRSVPVRARLGGCGGCDPDYFSWRVRRDEGRHLLAVVPGA